MLFLSFSKTKEETEHKRLPNSEDAKEEPGLRGRKVLWANHI